MGERTAVVSVVTAEMTVAIATATTTTTTTARWAFALAPGKVAWV
jgi:hypothetical protein